MAALSEEVKVFIVQRLACYDTPQQVADAVREEYGLEIDRRQVQSYDPERAGKKPGAKWCELHAETRGRFLKEVDQIPMSQKAVRLRRLERIYIRADSRKNDVLAKEAIIEAERICGGIYTNRRELTGKDGEPLMSGVLRVPTPVTAEEWSAVAAEQQRQLAEKSDV